MPCGSRWFELLGRKFEVLSYSCPWFLPASDIVEGMVNKGIFLNGDNGGTFLHFGSYQNSCISDPTFCGPEGECTVACMQMIIFRFYSVWPELICLSFSRDNLLLFLEKPRGRVPLCRSLRRESYLKWLLSIHQSLRWIRGVLYSRQQPQMES